MNSEALIFEYSVIRYVPDIEREEFLNVGLLMMCKRKGWFRSEIHLDADRLRALDPCVDLTALEAQLRMFNEDSNTLADLPAEERFRWLSAVKSCVIQTSRPHPGLTSDLDFTFHQLVNKLVK